MLGLGMPEIIVILVIVLVLFGPGKLPEMGKALGKSIREFKSATSESGEIAKDIKKEVKAVKEVLDK